MTNSGDPYWQEQHPQYQVDPLTGQPLRPGQQPTYQPAGYGGLGAYQGGAAPPPRPPKSNYVPLIISLVALVVVAGLTATLLLINRDDDVQPSAGGETTTESAPTTTSTTSSRPSSRPTSPTTTTSSLSPEDIKTDPVIPGWQGYLSPRDGAAYDVPPGWEFESPGTIVGYEDNEGKPVALMHGVTTYKPDVCPDTPASFRAHAGFVTTDDVDPTVAARGGVKLFAEAAGLNEDGSTSPVTVTEPTPTKVAQGEVDAVVATATLTLTQPGDCTAPSMLFTAVAFKTGSSTALFMLYQDQGTPDALPVDVAEQILTSVRPAE